MRIPNYYTLHMILIDVSVGLAAPYKTFEYGRVAVLCMNEQNRSCGVIIMILYRFRRFSLLHVVWSPNICSKESDDNIFFVYLHSIPSWFTCFCSQFFSFFFDSTWFSVLFFFCTQHKSAIEIKWIRSHLWRAHHFRWRTLIEWNWVSSNWRTWYKSIHRAHYIL